MATPPPSAQLNRNVTTHSYNSIGDTDVHAMRKYTRMKQREKRGNEAERISLDLEKQDAQQQV